MPSLARHVRLAPVDQRNRLTWRIGRGLILEEWSEGFARDAYEVQRAAEGLESADADGLQTIQKQTTPVGGCWMLVWRCKTATFGESPRTVGAHFFFLALGFFAGFFAGLAFGHPVTLMWVSCLSSAPFWATNSVGIVNGSATVCLTLRVTVRLRP